MARGASRGRSIGSLSGVYIVACRGIIQRLSCPSARARAVEARWRGGWWVAITIIKATRPAAHPSVIEIVSDLGIGVEVPRPSVDRVEGAADGPISR